MFLTLNVLDLPPFISSILFNYNKALIFLITNVIFLNPIFLMFYIVQVWVYLVSLIKACSFDLNLVLLPAASNTK